MKKRLTAGIAVFAVIALGAAGCTSQLDTDKLQDEIAKGIKTQTGTAVTVDCPTDKEVKKGDKFTCSVKAKSGGKTAKVEVTQTNDDGDVTWKLVG